MVVLGSRVVGLRTALMAVLLCLGASLGAHGQSSAPTVYRGICDASAAVALEADYFIVANDETNELRIYRRGFPEVIRDGFIDSNLDLNRALRTEIGKNGPKEADLEAGTRIGDRIYWMGSHSRDGDGKKAPARQRFLATDLVPAAGDPGVTVKVAGVYDGLLNDLLAQVKGIGLKEGAKHKPESPDGLNIEGLAATPDGQLLIGFRNPRPAGKALVIPLSNPAEVVEKGVRASFGKPALLDLGGRGVRSIDWVGNRYLIVAGPYDDNGAFALYSWSGPGGPGPQLEPGIVFGKLQPEALFPTSDPTQVYVLSDDGDKTFGGKTHCKHLPPGEQRFRGLAIDVPP